MRRLNPAEFAGLPTPSAERTRRTRTKDWRPAFLKALSNGHFGHAKRLAPDVPQGAEQDTADTLKGSEAAVDNRCRKRWDSYLCW